MARRRRPTARHRREPFDPAAIALRFPRHRPWSFAPVVTVPNLLTLALELLVAEPKPRPFFEQARCSAPTNRGRKKSGFGSATLRIAPRRRLCLNKSLLWDHDRTGAVVIGFRCARPEPLLSQELTARVRRVFLLGTMKPTIQEKPKAKYPHPHARQLALHQPRDSKTWEWSPPSLGKPLPKPLMDR